MHTKENFDHRWKCEDTDTNIGSNGDGSSWEVLRTTDPWKSRILLSSIGKYGVNNFKTPKQTP